MKLAVAPQFGTVTILILVFTRNAGAAEGSAEALGDGSIQDFSDGITQEFSDVSAKDFKDGIIEYFSDESAQASGDGSAQDYSDDMVDSSGGSAQASGNGNAQDYSDDIIDSSGGSEQALGDGIAQASGDLSAQDFGISSAHASGDGAVENLNDGPSKILVVEIVTSKKESTELTVRGIDIMVFLRSLMSRVESWAEDWWSFVAANINSPAEIWRQRKLFSGSVNLFPTRRGKREASDSKCTNGRKTRVCGIAPPRGKIAPHHRSKRVVNGTTSKKGQWPWMASIYIMDEYERVFNSCGGVLIDRDIVMSASHCFRAPEKNWTANIEQLYVRLGTTRNPRDQYIDPVDDEGSIISHVRAARIHPDFNSRTFDNDVALFLLDNPEVYRRNFMPICLPSSNEKDHSGDTGIVAGWGLLQFSGVLPPYLQETEVQIVSDVQCDDWYRNRTSWVHITRASLCAGYREGFKDACLGDSGGPLMIQGEGGLWTTVGIVSHGYKCAQLESPGVYVNVTKYRPWIDQMKIELYTLRQQNDKNTISNH